MNAELLKKRNDALARAAAADAKAVNGVLAAADQTEFDAAMAEVEQVDALAKAEKTASDRAARLAAAAAPQPRRTVQDGPLDGNAPPAARVTDVRERVLDDPKRGFANMGAFAHRLAAAFTPGMGQGDAMQTMAAATGMNQSTGADGGFLVPPEFSQMIWDGLNRSEDNLLARADQYTVTGESLTMNANAETSRATGSRYGGVRGYWIKEADQITSSKPTFRQMKLEPQQLAVLCYATDKLLRNAPALDQWIGRAATEEIAFLVSDAIINGNGVGQPKGILNGTAGGSGVARVSITKETGQAAATIVKENIDKMWARLHIRSMPNAVWFINQDCLPQLEQLSAVVGTGGVPVFLPAGGIADAPNARLKGRPVIPIEFAATCGTEGDIILADLGAYAVGLQGGVQSAMSMHLRFDYAENVFRFMFACDGQPWIAKPITPYKGTATVSPFVTLATRA